MGEKSKGGRETRKPKAEKNKKVKGQTPPPAAGTMQAAKAPRQAGPS